MKSIKIYGRCLWINRNVLHHFSFYLYSVQTSNFATWSGLNFKTNVEMVLFKWENLIRTIWWLSGTYIAWGNHLGSLSYRQLVSMSCGMQLFHLVLHPPWFKISRFIWKHSDTYTSVTRGNFLNNIYIQDMTEWTYDEK